MPTIVADALNTQKNIAEVIIDSLTPDGLLKIDFNELKESIACCSHEVDLSEIEQSLKIIQA